MFVACVPTSCGFRHRRPVASAWYSTIKTLSADKELRSCALMKPHPRSSSQCTSTVHQCEQPQQSHKIQIAWIPPLDATPRSQPVTEPFFRTGCTAKHAVSHSLNRFPHEPSFPGMLRVHCRIHGVAGVMYLNSSNSTPLSDHLPRPFRRPEQNHEDKRTPEISRTPVTK